MMFQFMSEGRKNPAVLAKSSWSRRVPSYSAFYSMHALCWLDAILPQTGRAISFTQSTNSNVNFTQKHPHRNTKNNHYLLWGPVKLTHKINHHRFYLLVHYSLFCTTPFSIMVISVSTKKISSMFCSLSSSTPFAYMFTLYPVLTTHSHGYN